MRAPLVYRCTCDLNPCEEWKPKPTELYDVPGIEIIFWTEVERGIRLLSELPKIFAVVMPGDFEITR